ncbi:hypothetical protein ACFQ08_10345 [Streptosporangium algeriense]|uniref:Secreted protein n=1 Tax=Streptosporangium algeriense TaxID=1682748 RepID=A0ABW3DQ94_9ACTN
MHRTRLAAAALAALIVGTGTSATPAGAAVDPSSSSGKASKAMAHIDIRVQVSPTSWSGDCARGHQFTFTAHISVLPRTKIRYRWIRSDNATAPVQELDFRLGPSTQAVGTTWWIGAPGTHWEAIEVLSPDSFVSQRASFHLQCTNRAAR